MNVSFAYLFVVVHGLLEVGDVGLVDLSNCLVMLGGHREPSHIRVDVDGLHQAPGRLCNGKGTLVDQTVPHLMRDFHL